MVESAPPNQAPMRYTPCWMDESAPHLPLAVGHVIRCPAFATGIKWKTAPDDPIMVAWQSASHVDYYLQSGQADCANDPARAQARFLVFSVSLVEAEGPDDVFPDSQRYARDVVCVRLDDDLSFSAKSERIRFSLNEPMSIAQPQESQIEIVGFVQLPIFREGGPSC